MRSIAAGSKDQHDTYDGPKSPSMESFGNPFRKKEDDCKQVEQALTDLLETSQQVSRPDSSESRQTFSFSTEESRPTSITDPIHCSYPMDDPEFIEIAKEFVERLDEKLKEMELAWFARDYDELTALGHWLKGCGGTAGFDAFTTPAKALERLAGQHNENLTRAAIVDLRQLAERIQIPATV